MVDSLLIANRGEIARRIARTARSMGHRVIALASDPDRDLPHVREADAAARLPGRSPTETYLNKDAVLDAALRFGADAVHPGYGFLSENADFAEGVMEAGLIWVGPPPAAIRAMGLKDEAKRRMRAAGVPVVPGADDSGQGDAALLEAARDVGFPVLIKASAGGGGRGMRVCSGEADFAEALKAARREAESAFGNAAVLVEKLIAKPRHVEVQVLADAHGNTLHLYERDCSLQRRRQKVVEEAPAPGIDAPTRRALTEAAVKAAQSVDYIGAGTVEFIADGARWPDPEAFFFLEMNTRLQVEHPVTEAITGLDLVEWQIRIARGEALSFGQEGVALNGHAVEARLYAEDPAQGFMPSGGRLDRFRLGGPGVRCDTGFEEGDTVPTDYDPMIAKVIVHGPDRRAAVDRLRGVLSSAQVRGPVTNAGFLVRTLEDERVRAGDVHVDLLEAEAHDWAAPPVLDDAVLAAAHLGRCAVLSRPAANNPWSVGDGWRALGKHRHHSTFDTPDGPVFITSEDSAQALSLWRGEKPMAGIGGYEIAQVQGGDDILTVRLFSDDKTARAPLLTAQVEALPAGAALYRQGFCQVLAEPQLGQSVDAKRAHGEDKLTAPMPGKVVQIVKEDGAAVTAGEAVIIMEAMKIEHTLRAPFAGIVALEGVSEGESVSLGALLARIVPDEEEGEALP